MIKLPYKTENYKVDFAAFSRVVQEVEATGELNCQQLGAIFGDPFWILLLMCMINSREEYLNMVLATLKEHGKF